MFDNEKQNIEFDCSLSSIENDRFRKNDGIDVVDSSSSGSVASSLIVTDVDQLYQFLYHYRLLLI